MKELQDKIIKLDDGYEIREYNSIYGRLRALLKNDYIQSINFMHEKNKYKLANTYYYFYDIPIDLNKKGKDYLALGGGAMSYPRYYINTYKDKRIDVVELNEKLIDINKKYFFLNDLYKECDPKKERLNIIIDDAIKYIKYCNKAYDYILIDLFDGRKPVKEIFKKNNIDNLLRILNDNGIIIINYIVCENIEDDFKILNNLIKEFKYNKIISQNGIFKKDTKTGNIIIVLSNKKIKIPDKYNFDEIYFN